MLRKANVVALKRQDTGGLTDFGVAADHGDLVKFLVDADLLDAEDKRDKKAIRAALTRYMNRVLYPQDRTLPRARARRARQRQKTGRRFFPIELDETALVEALMRNGFLPVDAAFSHEDTVRALQKVNELWIEDTT